MPDVASAPSEVATIISAASATASAISAAINFWNTRSFQRQQKSTTIDACVSASAALKAAVHKTLELKANKVDPITEPQIWGAYEDAWAKWVAFDQTFQIAKRHRNTFEQDAPDRTSALLSQLRVNLRDPAWIPGGANDPKDIRAGIDTIIAAIQRDSGSAD
ncbi:MAG TPA: hypothetical protein VFL62_05425 [Bradyrhizobium sp.]|uniref:hypothetical protein n=1 Tax=Bradyrhizobium sp. TaxID=376 RepID=UPI002D7EB7B0|nr:hypothetical protein [Bradyrhizobium sp.]HET7885649.1 hypothetical protein [Bradyrhizobium sp.]